MNAPCRVLLVINSLEGGGAERVVSILLGEFAKGIAASRGFEVSLALLDDLPRKYPVPEGCTVHVIGAQGSLWRSVMGLRRLIGVQRPNLCLAFLSRANFAAVLGCSRRGIPCLISERVNTTSHFSAPGLHNRLSEALIRLLYPRADGVLAVSGGVAADLADRHGVAADQITVIHNPYDLEAIRAAAAAPFPSSLAVERPYLVAVGRLTRNKNFAMLIEAHAASGVAEDLVILGEGEERAALEALITARAMQSRIHLPGFCDNPYPVIARARAFVSASNAEGFPNAAAEAMVLCRPVALTDCPSGPGELLAGKAGGPGKVVRTPFGLLTHPGDAAGLADAIRQLVAPEIAAELSAGAQQRMNDFRATEIADRYASAIAAHLPERAQ